MPSRRFLGVTLALLCALLALTARSQDAAESRTWTDATGKYRVQATFVELKGGKVVLRKEDGTKVQVNLTRLSDEDQQVARRAARDVRERTTQVGAADSEVAAQNNDWPQWRGPSRDGISRETGLLDSWPEGGPPLLWKVEGLGGGYSSVAVSGGKIFTMGNRGGTKVIALDATDGSMLWDAQVGGGGAPNCTPTVDGDLVYGLSHSGDLLCAEAATGREVWRKSFPNDFGGKMMSGWGYSESPLVDGDRLIVTPGAADAMIAALDKRTGQVIWKSPMAPNPGNAGGDGAAYSSIVISNAAGVKQYVQLVGRGVIGVDAKTGELLWGYNKVANGTANVPTPIATGDYIFCSSGYGDGGSALLKLNRSRGGITAEEVWYKRSNDLQNHHGGMILIGSDLYMGHGHNNGLPVCVDLKTGRKKWGPVRGPGRDSAAVVYADGHLYFRYENGVMALIEATPRRYNLKGSFQIAINNGKSWPHPVVANGRLYLRDQHELVCYDLRKN
jgi:outer membrane protein assembly factor BamB